MKIDFSLPPRYQDYTFASFPTNSANVSAHRQAKICASNHKKYRVVFITGGIGSGKSGIGSSIIRELDEKGLTYAYVRGEVLKLEAISNFLGSRNQYTALRRVIENRDVIFIDDFGIGLSDKSKSLKQAMMSFLEIISKRSDAKKTTILGVYYAINDEILARLRSHIEGYYSNVEIYMGEESLRTTQEIRTTSGQEETQQTPSFLGKSWLLEKYEKLSVFADQGLELLNTPNNEYKKFQTRIFEEYGNKVSKESEMKLLMENIKDSLASFHEFVDGLKFNTFIIHSDGAIELMSPNFLKKDEPPKDSPKM